MVVGDIKREFKVDSVENLEQVLKRRLGNDINSFWLTHDGAEFPKLSILVKDCWAAIHYFPEVGSAGHRSHVDPPIFTTADTMDFSLSEYVADDVVVTQHAVLPLSTAETVAKEFFLARERPNSIGWFEL